MALIGIRFTPVDQERAVGSVRGEVGKEGSLILSFDERPRLAKPHVGAVARELLPLAVHLVGVVEVVVVPVVRPLTDTAAVVPNNVCETLVLRPASFYKTC